MSLTQQLIDSIQEKNDEKVAHLLNIMHVEELNGGDDNGLSPLHHACINKDYLIVERLLAYPNINVNTEDTDGISPLHYACWNKNNQALELLLDTSTINVNAGDKNGYTPLHWACCDDNNEAVEQLLATADINVNACDRNGSTPLHLACLKNSRHVVTQLLAACDIHVNAGNSQGITPVMWSAKWCHIDTISLMLHDQRVHLNKKSNDGKGLEELVGVEDGSTSEKSACLELIREAKCIAEKRQIAQDLEEVRVNVRIQYIEKIDQVNKNIEDKEQLYKKKLRMKETRRNGLKEREEMEKKSLDKKLDPEILKFEQQKNLQEQQLTDLQKSLAHTKKSIAEIQQRKIRDSEEISRRYVFEKNKLEYMFKKEYDEHVQELANMRKVTNQLTKDLGNVDIDSNSETTVEAIRATLECPICLEMMKPPMQIWMCPSSHIICEPCKDKLEGRLCPTCRVERVTLRAFIVEQIARTTFNE